MATLKNTVIDDTAALQLPVGTTEQRTSVSKGMVRYNSSFKCAEFWDNTRWRYVPDILRDGLIFYFDAGEPSSYSGSGTTWSDLSGSGNNGTLVNGVSYSNTDGGTLSFDGVNDYVSTTSLNLQQNFTLEIWAKMTDASNFALFGQGGFVLNQGLHILYQSGSRGMIYGMFGNDNDYQENYRPSTNVWYNWVFTYNNSTFEKQFYANTELKIPGSSVQNQYTGSGQFNIGATYSSAFSTANGFISCARMYNRVLSYNEIRQNFYSQRYRFGV